MKITVKDLHEHKETVTLEKAVIDINYGDGEWLSLVAVEGGVVYVTGSDTLVVRAEERTKLFVGNQKAMRNK